MPNPIPPPYYARHFRFRQNELAGEAFPPAQVDVELDALLQSVNQAITVLRNITDANGRLRLQQPLREMRLIETLAYVATAGQTVFYLAPVTDPLTDRAEVQINTTGSLYAIVDATKVTVAAYTGTGTADATYLSNVYTLSAVAPDPIVGARLTVGGMDAGRVTARLTTYTVQTDTPWPLASVVGAALAWQNLATATLVGVTPAFVGGEKVQIALYTDGDGALSQLGSASASTGARQVAVFDAGAVLGASNVEDALQELASFILGLENALGPLSQYVKADGTVAMDADLNGGGNKAVGWAPGVAPGELVTYDQISTLIGIWNDLQQYYLKRDGTTQMNADLPLGSHKAVGMLAGVGPLDGVNVTQLSERIHKDGSVAMAADLQLGGNKIVDLAPGTNPTDAVILSQLTSLAGTNQIVYSQSVPGSYPFIVPAGVTQIRVKLWGPGGLGGLAINTGVAAGGGGGGACMEGVLTVTPGETLTIVITGGGSGLPSQILRAGVPQISAGAGGVGFAAFNMPALGGAGGVTVNDAGLPNMLGYVGQSGNSGLAYFGGPSFCIGGTGGSGAGGGGGGGNAGHIQIDGGTFTPGGPGQWPGGGGGGGTGPGLGAPGGVVFIY